MIQRLVLTITALVALNISVASNAANGEGTLSIIAGGLRLSLNEEARITEMASQAFDANYRHAKQPSYLLRIQEYGDKSEVRQRIENPLHLRVLSKDASGARVELDYDGGAVVSVEMHVRNGYLRMAVTEAKSRTGIAAVYWGPYATSMEGPIAEFLGLNRSDVFTIGLLGLNPNTDGRSTGGQCHAAALLPIFIGGSELCVVTADRSRPVGTDRGGKPVRTAAIPSQTVVGSAVALFGCEPAKELDLIEAIELGESLPHPMLNGQWAKRSPRATDSSFWANYEERNIDQWVALLDHAGVKTLCRYNPFGNWGHFEPDPKAFPHGIAGLRTCSDKAAAAGIRTTIYTLSTFLTGWSLPEPYLSPVPDKRLQSYLPTTTLFDAVDEAATQIALLGEVPELLNVFPVGVTKDNWVVRIDNELIAYKTVKRDDGRLLLGHCERGFANTRRSVHLPGAIAARMCFYPGIYYHSLFPGTEEMNDEVAANIAKMAQKAGFRHVIFDGLEETHSTGHGVYSENSFVRAVYERLPKENTTYTSSTMQQYDWHVFTHQSWGEADQKVGFRGTALDGRLWRQVQLKRNHMPSKMGQYYPNAETTAEDIEWLMARAAGYDAGVDFNVWNNLPKNRDIFSSVGHWEQARQSGAFSEKQKLLLRQTDCLFALVAKADGGWEPRFVRRWRSDHFESVPPSAAPVKSLSTETTKIAPCGIDFSWTHSPGIHERSCITDDLVHSGGLTGSDFEVGTPWSMERKQLLCVLRVPPDAPCAIRNPRLVISFGDKLNRQYQLDFRTTLEPGQYLSLPHQFPVASVYDANHQLLKEVQIHDMPALGNIKKVRVRITCEPTDPTSKTEIRVNLRFQDRLTR